MEDEKKLNEVKERIRKFCDDRDWDQFHSAKELAIGLSVEASELLEIFMWKNKEEGEALMSDPKKREHVEEEIADIFYYLVRLSQKYGVDLYKVFEDKMKKNEEKYPVDKVRGSSRKYDEY